MGNFSSHLTLQLSLSTSQLKTMTDQNIISTAMECTLLHSAIISGTWERHSIKAFLPTWHWLGSHSAQTLMFGRSHLYSNAVYTCLLFSWRKDGITLYFPLLNWFASFIGLILILMEWMEDAYRPVKLVSWIMVNQDGLMKEMLFK